MKQFIIVYFGVWILGIIHIIYSSSYPLAKTFKHLWSVDGVFFLGVVFTACLVGNAIALLPNAILNNKLAIKPLHKLLIHYVCSVVAYFSIIYYLSMLFSMA